ncbi:hypothetical protein K435DRAFT_797344 [Dendrothele bispora CBS 962.96]|uniref:Uncharacterized protein n=1 Tax=Dendrothele bispora (strain CBS 962.96) TaxID=1314807 RepID=A0A4S8M3I0_DENBC|nr:hypothetical protein K435DRAFT_797344 [Dendrothele bispora CBS 962.96]
MNSSWHKYQLMARGKEYIQYTGQESTDVWTFPDEALRAAEENIPVAVLNFSCAASNSAIDPSTGVAFSISETRSISRKEHQGILAYSLIGGNWGNLGTRSGSDDERRSGIEDNVRVCIHQEWIFPVTVLLDGILESTREVTGPVYGSKAKELLVKKAETIIHRANKHPPHRNPPKNRNILKPPLPVPRTQLGVSPVKMTPVYVKSEKVGLVTKGNRKDNLTIIHTPVANLEVFSSASFLTNLTKAVMLLRQEGKAGGKPGEKPEDSLSVTTLRDNFERKKIGWHLVCVHLCRLLARTPQCELSLKRSTATSDAIYASSPTRLFIGSISGGVQDDLLNKLLSANLKVLVLRISKIQMVRAIDLLNGIGLPALEGLKPMRRQKFFWMRTARNECVPTEDTVKRRLDQFVKKIHRKSEDATNQGLLDKDKFVTPPHLHHLQEVDLPENQRGLVIFAQYERDMKLAKDRDRIEMRERLAIWNDDELFYIDRARCSIFALATATSKEAGGTSKPEKATVFGQEEEEEEEATKRRKVPLDFSVVETGEKLKERLGDIRQSVSHDKSRTSRLRVKKLMVKYLGEMEDDDLMYRKFFEPSVKKLMVKYLGEMEDDNLMLFVLEHLKDHKGPQKLIEGLEHRSYTICTKIHCLFRVLFFF